MVHGCLPSVRSIRADWIEIFSDSGDSVAACHYRITLVEDRLRILGTLGV